MINGHGGTLNKACDTVKILLLDQQTLFREFLRQELERFDELHIVREVDDVHDAMRVIPQFAPDIILIDMFQAEHLIEVVELIRQACDDAKVLVLTSHEAPWVIRTTLDLGINGFLSKNISRRELNAAISTAACRDSGVVLLVASKTIAAAMRPEAPQQTEGLSLRERDVLQLASRGLTNAQIGKQLRITEGTVKRHLSNIYTKLGAVSRLDAVNKATIALLIPPATAETAGPRDLPSSETQELPRRRPPEAAA